MRTLTSGARFTGRVASLATLVYSGVDGDSNCVEDPYWFDGGAHVAAAQSLQETHTLYASSCTRPNEGLRSIVLYGLSQIRRPNLNLEGRTLATCLEKIAAGHAPPRFMIESEIKDMQFKISTDDGRQCNAIVFFNKHAFLFFPWKNATGTSNHPELEAKLFGEVGDNMGARAFLALGVPCRDAFDDHIVEGIMTYYNLDDEQPILPYRRRVQPHWRWGRRRRNQRTMATVGDAPIQLPPNAPARYRALVNKLTAISARRASNFIPSSPEHQLFTMSQRYAFNVIQAAAGCDYSDFYEDDRLVQAFSEDLAGDEE